MTGFGLSNDERRGAVADFAPAFRIARRAGLAVGPARRRAVRPGQRPRPAWTTCTPTGSGTASPRPSDPALLARLAAASITLEVCPASNVALGVAPEPSDVPLRALLDAGVPVALGADDPLLFGPRLTAQYEIARQVHGLTDEQLAGLARMSVTGSAAPPAVRAGPAGRHRRVAGRRRPRPGPGAGRPGRRPLAAATAA